MSRALAGVLAVLSACGSPVEQATSPPDLSVEVAVTAGDVIEISGKACPPDSSWRTQGDYEHTFFPVLVIEPFAGAARRTGSGKITPPSDEGGYVSAVLVLDEPVAEGGIKVIGIATDDGSWTATSPLPDGASGDTYVIDTTCITRDGLLLGVVIYEPAWFELP